ncbi:hypothetical protein LAG90_08035 [Marinilongibacter aquaticus]|uniref:hypothetical protein n=1 Tax=Marinilongibacter aquaticus TaxID=2975157 RepID=UPI0021BDA198|nr:hypothetical protein [Marinilongibacter aquaticus]UBM60589.1 hypothetical protein LAG90_08035 [Marinilongibacter aquaticus]
MKKRGIAYIYGLLAVLLFGQMLTACKEQDDVGSDEVELLSFGPSGVKPGDEIVFIGRNLDKVLSIELPGVSVPNAEFISQSKEQIEIKVPLETNEGLVSLTTADGEIVSKTQLSFNVEVRVDSFTEWAKPGQDITIKGEFMNWVRAVVFAQDTTVTEFVSQNMDELVVKVPFGAESGPLSIVYSGTEAKTIQTETALEVALPSITEFGPNPVKRDENLSIQGENLDLVKAVVFKGADPVMDFVSQSENTLVLAIPEGANKGKIALVAFSDIQVESEKALTFVGDLPDLPPLAYAFYEDGLVNGWQNWGWGSTADLANSDNVRDGEASAKFSFSGSWGALKFANNTVDLATYSTLTFAIFGAEGTEGKIFNLVLDDGSPYEVVLKEGEWLEFTIALEDLGSPESISTMTFQETGWSGTVYFDHIGLR